MAEAVTDTAIVTQVHSPELPTVEKLQRDMSQTVFAFRGYNVTNQGRTLDLLAKSRYRPIFESNLQQAAEICSDVLKTKVNLLDLLKNQTESSLQTYTEDVAQIVAVELSHIQILREIYELDISSAKYLCGYSLGEACAVLCAGIFDLPALLYPLLELSRDMVPLAEEVSMGVLFSRGEALDMDTVKKLCAEITAEGNGTIAISTYLSPNTVLILGQNNTIQRLKQIMHSALPKAVHMRKNPHHWPPMHTPITWQRYVPNKAGVMLSATPGGFTLPTPPLLSMVTGEANYNEFNSREILVQWVDHPMRVWDAVTKILSADVVRIIHVGPEPNILPATFQRLASNVSLQLSARTLEGFSKWAFSQIANRRPWLASILSRDATLLRAPFLEHIMLEEWLLTQDDTMQ